MIDRNKIIKMVCILAGIVVIASALSQAVQKNSITLGDYAKENPELAYMEKEEAGEDVSPGEGIPSDTLNNQTSDAANNIPQASNTDTKTESSDAGSEKEDADNQNNAAASALIGASLNGDSVIDQRVTYADSFYYEPLSDNLRRYITGVSYPAVSSSKDNTTEANASVNTTADSDAEAAQNTVTDLAITYDDLSYVHILHINFEGNATEGELICNKAIAQDLVEIFYELYQNEYQLESVRLIDEYDGDDDASMEDNNTSCFNYRVVSGSTSLSKHALGLAIDINPLYNPYITYKKDGTENIAPVSALPYADRDTSFPYKIDEDDLCYKLFTERGFTWGGNWNSCKDYQHFQKVIQ